MRRILLCLEFDGTAYHGWQVQKNGISVQSRVQDAIEDCIDVRAALTGCSRTDAGVHATGFCCTFDTEAAIPVSRIPAALNVRLPADIAVCRAAEVRGDFHPRYDALGKRYVYRILNTPTRRPLEDGRAWHITTPLPAEEMDRAAQVFVGTHDFSAFCAAGSDVQDKTRTVQACRVERQGDLLCFTVQADGFLYHMVRILTGTLVDQALGRIGPQAAETALRTGDRADAGRTAPAHGLYLEQVFYREEDVAWSKKKS